MIKSISLLGAAAAAIAVLPAVPAQAFQDAAAEDLNPNTEVVCRRVAAPTGTRIGARNICKTQREWDMIEAASRDELERATRARRNCGIGRQGGTACGG